MTTRRKISELPSTSNIAGVEAPASVGGTTYRVTLGTAAGKTAAAAGNAGAGEVPTCNSAGVIAREDGGLGERIPSASNQFFGTNSAGQPGFHLLSGASIPVWSSGNSYGDGELVIQASSAGARIYRSLKANNTDTLLTAASWQALGTPPTSETPTPQSGLDAAGGSTLHAALVNNGTLGEMAWELLGPENFNAGAAGVDRVLVSTGGQGMVWGLIRAGSIAAGAITADKLHVSAYGFTETIIWQAASLSAAIHTSGNNSQSAVQTLPSNRTFSTYDQLILVCSSSAQGAATSHHSAPYDLVSVGMARGTSLFNSDATAEFALPGGLGLFRLLTDTTWATYGNNNGNAAAMIIGRQRHPIQ